MAENVENIDNLLEVKNLQKFFPIQKGFLRQTIGHVRAVDDVSLTIKRGETLGLVGESGCGKTTVSRCILRALDPTAGEVLYSGLDEAGSPIDQIDVATLQHGDLKRLRREMQMIFQDPFSSLNPRMTLMDIVGEPLLVNGVGNASEREDRVAELLACSTKLIAKPLKLLCNTYPNSCNFFNRSVRQFKLTIFNSVLFNLFWK